MPSFAELKAKASGATSSGVEKLQNVRDRHTSVPMKDTNWDPYSGAPPPPPPPPRSLVNKSTKPTLVPLPPPPSRTSSAASPSISRNNSLSPAPPLPSRGPSSAAPPVLPSRSKGPAPPPPPPRSFPNWQPTPGPPAPLGPPPIIRSTRPNIQPRVTPVNTPASNDIDWVNLSPEDKLIFFSWLDEFFANFQPPVASAKSDDKGVIDRHISHTSLRLATKPASWVGPQSILVLSYPPVTKYGSAALDMAHYFSPTTPWSEAWYHSTGGLSVPPPLVGNTNHTYTSSWLSRGSNKTVNIGIFFSDLSTFWGSVDFTTDNPGQITRRAVYLPPPKALGKEELIEANETYGDTIALFAESFLDSGQYCARGECWDLANEGLKYFNDYDYIPKPVPSISRTHGHLIYEGKASNGGRDLVGRWRGGDDRIRRGDIVEWRRVKIGMKGARPGGSYYTLGDPDHTAVIVAECVPASIPKDGARLSPADLGSIAVVEQSQGQPPERRVYDLSNFQEGEMWVYRPISMSAYLGLSAITPVPPEGLLGLQRL